MTEMDKEKLRKAANAVIDTLSPYPWEYKIITLRNLMESFPIKYKIVEKDGKCLVVFEK